MLLHNYLVIKNFNIFSFYIFIFCYEIVSVSVHSYHWIFFIFIVVLIFNSHCYSSILQLWKKLYLLRTVTLPWILHLSFHWGTGQSLDYNSYHDISEENDKQATVTGLYFALWPPGGAGEIHVLWGIPVWAGRETRGENRTSHWRRLELKVFCRQTYIDVHLSASPAEHR